MAWKENKAWKGKKAWKESISREEIFDFRLIAKIIELVLIKIEAGYNQTARSKNNWARLINSQK